MTKETKKRNNRKLFGTSKKSLYIIRTWINLKNKTQLLNKHIYVYAGQLDYEPRFSIKFKNPRSIKTERLDNSFKTLENKNKSERALICRFKTFPRVLRNSTNLLGFQFCSRLRFYV